jgi:CheY-like chemotaxis protein
LAGNAVKFTSAGEVVIRATCDLRVERTALIRISVRDSGPGIAPEKVRLLFQKFSQLDMSTSRKYGGTGLGLAISKQLVELMCGTIGVDSTEGEGATFWFALPLRLNPGACADGSADPPQLGPRGSAALWGRFEASSARVLVVEDNIVNQKVAVRMLERLGIRVDVAGNGREAVQMCGVLAYDAILMDCQMPEMDGYQAVGQIRRKEESDRRVPIIAMTADAFVECRDRCREAGMDDYLAKPVRLESLAEVLKKWVPLGT